MTAAYTLCCALSPFMRSVVMAIALQVGEMTGAKIDKLRNLIESALEN